MNRDYPYNGLVSNQFSPDSFQVVSTLYNNLNTLKQVQSCLGSISLLADNYYRLQDIMQYVDSIEDVSRNLNKLLDLEYNIPFLKNIYPRVEQFANDVRAIQDKLTNFDADYQEAVNITQSNVKHLEDLYVQYENGLQELIQEFELSLNAFNEGYIKKAEALYSDMVQAVDYIKQFIPTVNEYAGMSQDLNARIAKLEASEAVAYAQYSCALSDCYTAEKAIMASERWGNNESRNRMLLEMQKADGKFYADDVLAELKAQGKIPNIPVGCV